LINARKVSKFGALVSDRHEALFNGDFLQSVPRRRRLHAIGAHAPAVNGLELGRTSVRIVAERADVLGDALAKLDEVRFEFAQHVSRHQSRQCLAQKAVFCVRVADARRRLHEERTRSRMHW
jgi:hypothetical protein